MKQLGPDLPKILITCKCPTCDREHEMSLRWVGRQMPRKICRRCRKLTENMDAGFAHTLAKAIMVEKEGNYRL